MREQSTLEGGGDGVAHLLHSLVTSATAFAVDAGEAGERDLGLDACGVALVAGAAAAGFGGAVDGAEHFGLAHFEVGGAVGGGLSGAA